MSTLSPRLQAIADALPLEPGLRVLEVGCGPGALARAMAGRVAPGHVLGIDRSARAVAQAVAASGDELAAGRLSFRQVAAEDFALERGEPPFDLIVAVRVGAFDGRHPKAGSRARPRMAAALAPGGRCVVDGVAYALDEQRAKDRPVARGPMTMKMILTTANTPGEYIECLSGWQRRYVQALRQAVLDAAPELKEQLKWGHLVYLLNGPVLLIRSEPARLLLGFWRGQRLRHIEPRLNPGGKYEMASLELRDTTPLDRNTVVQLVRQASRLNLSLGDPTLVVKR